MLLLPVIKNIVKQIVFTALLCFFSYRESFAQYIVVPQPLPGTITGVVFDSSTQDKLSHVTVELQEAEKTTATKNTSTDENGLFSFTGLSTKKHYHLILTYIGYRSVKLQVPSLTTSSVHLAPIALVSLSKELKEIQVTTQRPLLEYSLDKLTFNVEADPESKTASALDILRKIPLLSLGADDNLQLNGNSNYRVLINGKSSSLFSGNRSVLFKNLPASAIKTIEVITVPPSKYEAQGIGGIINITTYKKVNKGYNGGFNLSVSDPEAISANGNLAIKVGKINLSGNFGHSNNINPKNSNSLFREDKIRQARLKQTSSNHSNNWSQNGGGEISLELNDHNLLTAGYSINRGSSLNNFIQGALLLNALGEQTEAYRHLNTGYSKQSGSDFSFDYQHNARKNETRQLNLSYQQSNSTSGNSSDFMLQPLLNYTKQWSTTSNEDAFSEQTLQLDYVQPIREHTLELGASGIRRRNTSDYFYKNLDTASGAFVLDTAQSNSFNYYEYIYAGYTSLNLRMGKWGLKTGVRLEQARLKGRFTSSGTSTSREYLDLIPTITLSRKLKGTSSLRLSYTQRLQRPNLYYLDPYVDLTDPYNISYGNPGLQPALANVFNLTYTTFIKKTSVSISTLHQFTHNSIQQFTTLGADTVARTTFGNIGQNRNTSFSLGINTTLFKNLTINLNGNTNYQEYSSLINGKKRNNEGLTYNLSGNVNLRLKTWRISSSMSYNAPNILVQGRTAAYTSNSATLNKYFLKNNKANIALSVTSLFSEHRRSFIEIDDPTFYLLRASTSVIRQYNLSLNYRFAKVQGSASEKAK